MHPLLLIINPIAGAGNNRNLIGRIADRLRRHGIDLDIHLTTGPGDATRVAREAVSLGYRGVIAAGGDGTVNEVASSLVNAPVALGIIPCGSGNGLARHLHIPIDVDESADIIAAGTVRRIDHATVGSRPFFCTCGIGFDAAVAQRFASKGTRGLHTYLQSMVEEFRTFRPSRYTITINGHTIVEDAFTVAVCNASQYGNNAYIAPEAAIDDGLLDITVIHAAPALGTLHVGFDMMMGNLGHNHRIAHFRASALTILHPGCPAVHIDGEPASIPERLDIQCHPRSLSVFAPAGPHHITPFLTPAIEALQATRLTLKHLLGL